MMMDDWRTDQLAGRKDKPTDRFMTNLFTKWLTEMTE